MLNVTTHHCITTQNRPVEDVESMYKAGLNKMYSEWREGRDLIEWMRRHNQKHGNRLQYFGLDIGGFYQNWKCPLDLVYGYLEKVDPGFARTLMANLAPFLSVMTENARVNYNEKLGPIERAQLAIHLQVYISDF